MAAYDLGLNKTTRFQDKNVLALNYATDRQQLVELAYLNSTHTAVVPFSSYISNWVDGDLKAAIDSTVAHPAQTRWQNI